MNKYKYTLMNRGKAVIQTNDKELVRDGVKELGNKAYIKYNKLGINSYQEDKRWETSNA